jgi:hypothetical protein
MHSPRAVKAAFSKPGDLVLDSGTDEISLTRERSTCSVIGTGDYHESALAAPTHRGTLR